MKRIHVQAAICAGMMLVSFCGAQVSAVHADLDKQIASVLPTAEEDAWLNVGWQLNLMQAREQAKKQLFLWVMNGHPLGCT
jgi:hypothetical protein